jgi:hypothetical protein
MAIHELHKQFLSQGTSYDFERSFNIGVWLISADLVLIWRDWEVTKYR